MEDRYIIAFLTSIVTYKYTKEKKIERKNERF